MTVVRHTRPCNYCPFVRTSAPGYLGAATPEEFLGSTQGEAHMPCHSSIDYEDPDWRETLPDASHCAGSLIFLKNICQLPRDADLAEKRAQVEPNHAEVFSRPDQFLDHHK